MIQKDRYYECIYSLTVCPYGQSDRILYREDEMTVLDFSKRKQNNQKISMVTCYDATFAHLIGKTAIDCILIGDSCAMIVYGEKTTIPMKTPALARHTAAVRNGAPEKFIVADMPFLSFREGKKHAVQAAGILIRAGADAVKLEGCDGNEKIITHLVESGIPVMGHLGLTPQFYHSLGGYKIQGRNAAAAEKIKSQAARLQEAGCFSLVLECVPEQLAAEIAQALSIPVIGIGAGRHVDGQVLVLHDLLGLTEFKPTFVHHYLDGAALVTDALNQYTQDVSAGVFPHETEVFSS